MIHCNESYKSIVTVNQISYNRTQMNTKKFQQQFVLTNKERKIMNIVHFVLHHWLATIPFRIPKEMDPDKSMLFLYPPIEKTDTWSLVENHERNTQNCLIFLTNGSFTIEGPFSDRGKTFRCPKMHALYPISGYSNLETSSQYLRFTVVKFLFGIKSFLWIRRFLNPSPQRKHWFFVKIMRSETNEDKI